MDIVQGMRRQDGIFNMRSNHNEYSSPVEGGGIEGRRQSNVSACSRAKEKGNVTNIVTLQDLKSHAG